MHVCATLYENLVAAIRGPDFLLSEACEDTFPDQDDHSSKLVISSGGGRTASLKSVPFV